MNIYLNDRILFDGGIWLPESGASFNETMTTLLHTLNAYLFIPEANVFYCGAGLDYFFENLMQIEELLDYSMTNPIQKLRMILNDVEASDWTANKKQKDDCHYYHITANIENLFVGNSTIAEALECSFRGEVVSLVNFASSDFIEKPLCGFKKEVNPPKEITFAKVPVIIEKKQALDNYHLTRAKRVYDWNKKHGDVNRPIIPNKGEEVSPLECTIKEAADLLECAVGYRNTNELYVYDNLRQKYMVYKRDHNGNYHSYHPINQDEVDQNIKMFLR